VSNFNYRSFKDLDFKRRLPFRYLVIGVFIFAMVAIRPEVMLFALFFTYALLGAIFGVFKKAKKDKNSDADEDQLEFKEEI